MIFKNLKDLEDQMPISLCIGLRERMITEGITYPEAWEGYVSDVIEWTTEQFGEPLSFYYDRHSSHFVVACPGVWTFLTIQEGALFRFESEEHAALFTLYNL